MSKEGFVTTLPCNVSSHSANTFNVSNISSSGANDPGALNSSVVPTASPMARPKRLPRYRSLNSFCGIVSSQVDEILLFSFSLTYLFHRGPLLLLELLCWCHKEPGRLMWRKTFPDEGRGHLIDLPEGSNWHQPRVDPALRDGSGGPVGLR